MGIMMPKGKATTKWAIVERNSRNSSTTENRQQQVNVFRDKIKRLQGKLIGKANKKHC